MNRVDLHNSIRTRTGIKPVALTTTAGVAGKIVDTKGYNGVEVVFSFGEITATNATITALLMEGDATGSMTSVADADLLGTEVLASVAAGARTSGTGKNVTKRIGYTGLKRYIQPKIAASTVTAATIVSAVVILHTPEIGATPNP